MRILVTGSTDGIGLATATRLAQMGHAVVVHGRDEKRVEAAVAVVGAAGERAVPVDAIVGDLSSLESVDAMAAEAAHRFPDLAVLVNNAGVMRRDRAESVDGYELNLAVNHLAHMLLALRLLPTLRGAGRPGAPARIVNVASMVHEYNGINWDDLHFRKRYDGQAAYGQSKVANVMFTRALPARLGAAASTIGGGAGRATVEAANTAPWVTVNALHPGVIDTKLLHVYYGGGATTESGARTSVFLATEPALAEITGRYFSDEREKESWVLTASPDESERLWSASVEMIEAVVREPLPAEF